MALVHTVGGSPQLASRSAWLWPLAQAAQRLEACTDFPTLAELDALYAAQAQARGAQAAALSHRPAHARARADPRAL